MILFFVSLVYIVVFICFSKLLGFPFLLEKKIRKQSKREYELT